MSLRVPVQRAPVASAVPGAPSAWSGASTTTPTVVGIYEGRSNKTFTFTVNTAGTIGTAGVVTWSDGNETGRLDLGSTYTAGDYRMVHQGISIAFSAGALSAADTFTVDVTAERGLPWYAGIDGGGTPDQVAIRGVSAQPLDLFFQDDVGTTRRKAIAIQHNPNLFVDNCKDTERAALQQLRNSRSRVTVGENYDGSTVGLLRLSRGIMPLIGKRPNFSRSGVGSYIDQDTGLIRLADSGNPRIQTTGASGGLLLDVGATNLLQSSNPNDTLPGWTATSGAPTLTTVTTMPTVFDQSETSWTDLSIRNRSLKVEMAASNVINTTFNATISSTTTYTGSVWIKGRGQVTVSLRTGSVSPPPTVQDSEQLTLDGDDWQRVVLTGTSGGSDDRANLTIVADEKSVIWVGPSQIEAGHVATAWIETQLSTQSRAAESFTWDVDIPATGSFSMWVKVPDGSPTGDYYLVETSSSGRWGIRYDATNGEVEFHTASSGALVGTQSLTPGSVYQIAVTWSRSSTAGELNRALYVNGSLITSDSTTNWGSGWGGTLEFEKSGGTALHSWQYAELRMDSVEWSSTTVSEIYSRRTSDEWLHTLAQFGGRFYDIGAMTETWLSDATPDRILVDLPLTQASTEPDALVVPL